MNERKHRMLNILAISDEFPIDRLSGRHLRVNALCTELAIEHNVFFVAVASQMTVVPESETEGFAAHMHVQKPAREKKNILRVFRSSDEQYLRMTAPNFVAASDEVVRKCIEDWSVDVVINFAPALAEIAIDSAVPKVFDNPDCDTLTIERFLAGRGDSISIIKRISSLIQLRRAEARERYLIDSYDLITTIASPDGDRLRQSAGRGDSRIAIVPNGVSRKFLSTEIHRESRERSVVFWGNLDFPPNWTAVEFFYKQVYLPYLADKGVRWTIIGKGAGDNISRIGEHPLVSMAGFVEDLAGFCNSQGAMINPMTEGSGLKNKVLEAFAIGLPVVSTSLGVEALDVVDGEHLLIGDRPDALATAILDILDDNSMADKLSAAGREFVAENYGWEHAGSKMIEAIRSIL